MEKGSEKTYVPIMELVEVGVDGSWKRVGKEKAGEGTSLVKGRNATAAAGADES